jgi:hypothetical protein
MQISQRFRARAVKTALRVSPRTVRALQRRRAGANPVPVRLPTGRDVAELRRRVSELEAEVQENRQLHSRLAELTDIVQELLLPIARRDEEQIEETLRRYSTKL